MKKIFVTLAALIVLTACNSADSTEVYTEAETPAEYVSEEYDESYETEETEPESYSDSDYPVIAKTMSDFAGWYYRPEDLDGLPIISIFELNDDGNWKSYDTIGNVVMEGTSYIDEYGDILVMELEFFGEVRLSYYDGELTDETGEVAFRRGEPLAAEDMSFLYNTWLLDNTEGGDTLTLNEDGTYEKFDSFYEIIYQGTYVLRAMENMISGYGTEPRLVIEMDDTGFMSDDYYFLPGEQIIYNEDTWDELSVYALPGTDSETFERGKNTAKLLCNTHYNENFQVTFYQSGIFSVDQIVRDENSSSYSYYAHGTYEVNDDFTSIYVSFDDGSFEGECPLDTQENIIFIEPLGELK
jgi:hypothetical protein